MWEWIEKVIIISLREEKVRREKARDELKKVGLDTKIEFYIAERHPNGGRQGCHESHVNVIKKCHNEGLKNVIIMEDDVKVSKNLNLDKLQKYSDRLQNFVTKSNFSNENAILYLGYMLVPDLFPKNVGFDGIKKVKKTTMMHAYIPSFKSLQKLKDVKYEGVHIDWLWGVKSKYVKRKYIFIPIIFSQNDLGSTVTPLNTILQKTIGFENATSFVNHFSFFWWLYLIVFLLIIIVFYVYYIK